MVGIAGWVSWHCHSGIDGYCHGRGTVTVGAVVVGLVGTVTGAWWLPIVGVVTMGTYKVGTVGGRGG